MTTPHTDAAPPPGPEGGAAAPTPAAPPRRLADIAIARSGDKGNRATLSVIALDPAHYPLLAQWLTAERVRAAYAGVVLGRVDRHLLPQLGAVHFVLHDALAGGVTRSLALDAHGKSLGSAVLGLEVVGGEGGGHSAASSTGLEAPASTLRSP